VTSPTLCTRNSRTAVEDAFGGAAINSNARPTVRAAVRQHAKTLRIGTLLSEGDSRTHSTRDNDATPKQAARTIARPSP
jgi:hypothetical protein